MHSWLQCYDKSSKKPICKPESPKVHVTLGHKFKMLRQLNSQEMLYRQSLVGTVMRLKSLEVWLPLLRSICNRLRAATGKVGWTLYLLHRKNAVSNARQNLAPAEAVSCSPGYVIFNRCPVWEKV